MAAAVAAAARGARRHVIVAGGSGFLGRYVVRALRRSGYASVVVTRGGHPAYDAEPSAVLRWSQVQHHSRPWPWPVHAVVNLSGAQVLSPEPWTASFAATLRDSRVGSTQALAEAIARCPDDEKPQVLVNASGVGVYPAAADATKAVECDESYVPSEEQRRDFWADLVLRWEAAAEGAKALTPALRVAYLRTGVVLGRGGGAFERARPAFAMGLGARIGSGAQPFPWIHARDFAALCVHTIESTSLSGAVNAVSPDHVTNADFSAALASVYGRRAPSLAVPAGALELALGAERARMLLTGQVVRPTRALESGFAFRYAALQQALSECAAKHEDDS